MTLDRWIAFIILLICLCYGYEAFFMMDSGLPPFMQRNPVWPSTFPKMLAVMGVVVSSAILLGLEKKDQTPAEGDINYHALGGFSNHWCRCVRRTEVPVPDPNRRHGRRVCVVFGTGCFGHISAPMAFFSGDRIG